MSTVHYQQPFGVDSTIPQGDHAEFIKPTSFIMTTRYFWRKWRPILGNSLAVLVIEARSRCYLNRKTGERRDFFYSSLTDFAESAGFSAKQTSRLLKRPHAAEFIQYRPTYIYDAERGKRIMGKCLFRVSLEDPLTPQDQSDLYALHIHNPVSFRERPAGQNVFEVATSRERNSIQGAPPYGQNVRNIYNTINNNNIATATANNNTDESPGKAGKDLADDIEEFVAAVRRFFQNRISQRKVIELIEKSSPENVKNQLAWFPHRDNSWAVKGPVVAFITYCEQRLEAPAGSAYQPKQIEHRLKAGYEDAHINDQIRANYLARRAKYKNPERYDELFRQLSKQIASQSPLNRAMLGSCFIADVWKKGTGKVLIIDTPNAFYKFWLQRAYKEKLVSEILGRFNSDIEIEITLGRD